MSGVAPVDVRQLSLNLKMGKASMLSMMNIIHHRLCISKKCYSIETLAHCVSHCLQVASPLRMSSLVLHGSTTWVFCSWPCKHCSKLSNSPEPQLGRP